MTVMSRKLAAALLAAVAGAAAAHAQVSGPIPGSGMYGDDTACCFNMGLLPDYDQVRTPEQRELDRQIELDYRAAMKKIPDRKGSNDPWKGIRSTASPAPYDRHRPQ